jgi:hypothetical protein
VSNPGGAAGKLAALLIAALWAIQEVLIVSPSEVLAQWALVSLAVYCLCAFLIARASVRLVAAMAISAAAALVLHYGHGGSIVRGAQAGMLFIAFLATMQLLRISIEANVRPEGDPGAAGNPGEHWVLLRSWLLATVFAAGAVALAASRVETRPPDERLLFGQAALHGIGLALLWSPFFVAMSLCTRLSREVSLQSAVLNGIVMSLIGLGTCLVIYRSFPRLRELRTLSGAFFASAAMAVLVVALNAAWGVSNAQAIVLVMPLIAAALILQATRGSPGEGAVHLRHWAQSLRGIAPEALVVTVSLILGEVITDLLGGGRFSVPAALQALPVATQIAWPAVVMAALAVLGFHPVIGASLLFPLQASMSALDPVVAAASVMVGWMVGILVSAFAVPIMFASTVFQVPAWRLVTGRGLRCVAAVVPMLWAYLWLLNAVLRGG